MQDAIRLIFSSRHFRTAKSAGIAANLPACSVLLSSSSFAAVLLKPEIGEPSPRLMRAWSGSNDESCT